MFIIFFGFPFLFLFFTAWPAIRYPPPATRHPLPATRLPATCHPRKSPAAIFSMLPEMSKDVLTTFEHFQSYLKADNFSAFWLC